MSRTQDPASHRRASDIPGTTRSVRDPSDARSTRGLIIELSERQRPDEDDERRRYYRITAFGRAVAQAEAVRLATLLRQAKAVGLAPGRA
jgi:hypothetical protein